MFAQRGFPQKAVNLIELLVAGATIARLAAVLRPALSKARKRQKVVNEK